VTAAARVASIARAGAARLSTRSASASTPADEARSTAALAVGGRRSTPSVVDRLFSLRWRRNARRADFAMSREAPTSAVVDRRWARPACAAGRRALEFASRLQYFS